MEDYLAKLVDLAHGGDVAPASTCLDPKTGALLVVGALIATGASPDAYVGTVRSALNDGVSIDEIVDALIAVSTTVGAARVVSASRGLSVALGYDIDAAIEDR